MLIGIFLIHMIIDTTRKAIELFNDRKLNMSSRRGLHITLTLKLLKSSGVSMPGYSHNDGDKLLLQERSEAIS
jgi:hypothetical protein